MNKSQPIICLMGPTASGKTAVAIELAQQLPCDIISVDSAMVYKGMDIGTAKPSTDELLIAPHYLIDILDPSQSYSAGQFRSDALAIIENSFTKKRIPLLVGGTMLYFRALQMGLSSLPHADSAIRNEIAQLAQAHGWHVLHEKLKQIDSAVAARINPNDAQRIQRALEIHYLTGKSISMAYQQKEELGPNYLWLNIVFLPENRIQLQERIEKRFHSMLASGFVEEVERLYNRGDLNNDLPSIRAVGYRQIWQYLAGEYAYKEMLERGIIATRQLAKRQITWLRKWPSQVVINIDENSSTKYLVGRALEAVKKLISFGG